MTMPSHSNEFGECTETFYGLYPGVAEKVVDPENRGRITVLLPWISDTYETRFASVAQVYAGDGYGVVWLPEQGDQVVVAFMKGQLSRPVVLGSIYSKARKPTAGRTEAEDPKVFRTKGGHTDTYMGALRYRLRRTDGALRIQAKRCVLDLDGLRPHGRISIIL